MDRIINYIINMIPYILLVLPIYVIVRIFFLKVRNKNINYTHEIYLLIFVLFLSGLISQTVIPPTPIDININLKTNFNHTMNLIPFRVLYDIYNELKSGNINNLIINFIGNIVMFIPIGFFSILLWNISDKKVILLGTCISFFIEMCQLFLSRGTDIDDILLNTIGTLIGLIIYKLISKIFDIKRVRNV